MCAIIVVGTAWLFTQEATAEPQTGRKDFIRDHGSSAVFAVLGVLLLAAGAFTLRQGRSG